MIFFNWFRDILTEGFLQRVDMGFNRLAGSAQGYYREHQERLKVIEERYGVTLPAARKHLQAIILRHEQIRRRIDIGRNVADSGSEKERRIDKDRNNGYYGNMAGVDRIQLQAIVDNPKLVETVAQYLKLIPFYREGDVPVQIKILKKQPDNTPSEGFIWARFEVFKNHNALVIYFSSE